MNDVGWVLGIPGPNRRVPKIFCPKMLLQLKVKFGNDKGIDEKSTFRLIVNSIDAEIEFKESFLVYTLGVLLCPTQSCKISPTH